MNKFPKLFCFLLFVVLVRSQLLLVADSAPIKFNGWPDESNENNKHPSKYSDVMKNKSTVTEMKLERDDDIAYAIPKRYIKWDIGNMDL